MALPPFTRRRGGPQGEVARVEKRNRPPAAVGCERRKAKEAGVNSGQVRSDLRQLPGISALPVEQGVGRLVADEPLLRRVPLEFASDLDGDVGQVTDRGDAVANLDGEIRILAALDALQEVVVLALGVV